MFCACGPKIRMSFYFIFGLGECANVVRGWSSLLHGSMTRLRRRNRSYPVDAAAPLQMWRTQSSVSGWLGQVKRRSSSRNIGSQTMNFIKAEQTKHMNLQWMYPMTTSRIKTPTCQQSWCMLMPKRMNSQNLLLMERNGLGWRWRINTRAGAWRKSRRNPTS